MKRIMKIAALALVVVLGSSLRNNISAQPYDDYDQDRDVSYQTFYDELSPHGRWVDYPGHGYVWVPNAENDFRPYSTNGHWVWTDDYEWMWVSDYDWGWAPFHYGRWDHDDYYGWYWVPGYEWSPAWVAWRDGGDYYGWAPIRPGINISINFNIGGYAPPVDFWCFAPRRYITSPRIHDYYVDRRRNVTIIHQTTIIINNFRYSNNYGFRSGPRRYDAEVYCGRINPVRFRQSYSPGRTFYRNNEVSVYRPSIRQNNNRQVAPRNFERYDRSNTNGSFRNRTNNNGDVRRDDNNSRRDNNTVRPDSRDRADNRTFRRNENDVRQPGNDRNSPIARERGSERPERNQGSVEGNNNRRFERNNDQPARQPQVERRQERPQPQRQPQMERRQEQRQPQTERRQEPRPQPQVERRQEQRQPQVERRQESRPQPQMERRQEQRQPAQQQPSRQFERRDDGNRNGGGNNGNGNGNGNRGGRKRD